MPESLLLLAALTVAAVLVLAPLWRERRDAPDDDDAASIRHRVALEALRDVETDRRAGSLDDAAYAEQLAEAETRAAATRAALEEGSTARPHPRRSGERRLAIGAAGLIAALLLGGSFVPATGIPNRTELNRSLAEAETTEAARQQRIRELREALAADPRDREALSALADAHLAGSGREDLVRAAVALQLLIQLGPDRPDAYERIMTAYLRAGDHGNARAAHSAYVALDAADPAEAAFFDGLIALRGENDPAAALAAFDRFLELAPDDPRAAMIRGLRDEAAGSGS